MFLDKDGSCSSGPEFSSANLRHPLGTQGALDGIVLDKNLER
jgi:hypothetical protein